MKHFIALAVFLAFVAGHGFGQGFPRVPPEPFGFRMGMTEAQVLAIIGKGTVREQNGDTLVVSTAPKPCPDCETYGLAFSPTQGLLKVTASTKTITTNDEGDQLLDEYNKIVEILTAKYGKPETADFVRNDSEADPRFWMLSLYDKERTLAAYWNYGKRGHGGDTEAGISVETRALSINTGYVAIAYEFPGWNAYVDSKAAKQNSSF